MVTGRQTHLLLPRERPLSIFMYNLAFVVGFTVSLSIFSVVFFTLRVFKLYDVRYAVLLLRSVRCRTKLTSKKAALSQGNRAMPQSSFRFKLRRHTRL